MKQTTLDLNGPILSFIEQPSSTSVCGTGIATFIGIATVSFPSQTPANTPTNTGSLSYRWYSTGYGALSDGNFLGSTISGTGTTTLTIVTSENPSFNEVNFYLTADYIPSAYQSSSPVTAGTARSTGNAVNDVLVSGISTLSLFPNISIVTQPTSQTILQNRNVTFSVEADSTDDTQGSFSYQWSLDGVNLNDGLNTVTNPINQFDKTYYDDDEIILPADATDVTITVAGANGGTGGADSFGGGGVGGLGRTGTFRLPDGSRTLSFNIGKTGINGSSGNQSAWGEGGASSAAAGGRGGGAGQLGYSGGGAGGGGATGVYESTKNGFIVVAGGGGGGGGGSANVSAGPGGNAQTWVAVGDSPPGSSDPSVPKLTSPGTAGSTKDGDGGGGGGGGGGAPGASGGGSGQDSSAGGGSGNGGGSAYNSTILTFVDGSSSTNDDEGYVNLRFKSSTVVPGSIVNPTKSVNVTSGSKSPDLVISGDTVGVSTVRCRVDHTLACNSPLFTDIVNFNVLSSRFILNYESYQEDPVALLDSGSQNIFNGSVVLTADPNNPGRTALIYPPERDMRVRITMAAAGGLSRGARGGEGGLSVFEYDLIQNNEYIFKLGSSSAPTGGINGGGGGAFFYNKARLIACCGGGGGSGTGFRGGDGGGMNIGGEFGQGPTGGTGGIRINQGGLETYGFFPGGAYCCGVNWSSPTAGRTSGCSIGNYYRDKISPCVDLGVQKYVNQAGSTLESSASILRGYKSGLAHRNNGGNGSGNEGGGGSGAYGGDASVGSNGSGGGGGSGYSNGEATIISTQLGGNSGSNAYVIIELVEV